METTSHRITPTASLSELFRNQLARPLATLVIGTSVAAALAFGLLQAVNAETQFSSNNASPSELAAPAGAQPYPNPVSFMMGNVSFTWTYRNNVDMPFTEHHSISSDDLADALNRDGPVRVATADSGELLITTVTSAPNVILSARRYADWTLISVLKNSDDPASSAGVFKFCSIDADVNRCADSVLQYPDGTVTMTSGASNAEIADMAKELDHSSITEKLVALLTL